MAHHCLAPLSRGGEQQQPFTQIKNGLSKRGVGVCPPRAWANADVWCDGAPVVDCNSSGYSA